MNIGIFTFFQTNYGAVLQAYALQHYLEQNADAHVEIVDFTTAEHLKAHKVFQKATGRNPFKALKFYFCTLVHYKQLRGRIDKTWAFKEKYFHFTRRYSSVEDLIHNPPKEDIYITGSDQVFNPKGQYLPVYYLGFEKGVGIKAAYAPSFGISQFPDDLTKRISPYLKDFDFLSCRESSGAEYLSSITGEEVPVVVDPVLLHNATEWGKVAISPAFEDDYIFIYDLNGAENLVRIAKAIQKETNLPIVCLTGNRVKRYSVDKQIFDAGPAEFIGWIKSASFVVTDSFHGTVFSLIFNKQFYSFIAYERTSFRIRNILRQVGMEQRLITKEGLGSFDYTITPKRENVELDSLAAYSKAFIKSIIS